MGTCEEYTMIEFADKCKSLDTWWHAIVDNSEVDNEFKKSIHDVRNHAAHVRHKLPRRFDGVSKIVLFRDTTDEDLERLAKEKRWTVDGLKLIAEARARAVALLTTDDIIDEMQKVIDEYDEIDFPMEFKIMDEMGSLFKKMSMEW